MHEMSLCESIVQIIEEQARVQNFERVRRVVLRVGELAAVDPQALRFCFGAVAAGGVARDAQLDIRNIPGVVWCMDCAAQVRVSRRHEACPGCGGHQTVLQGGDDLRIQELEVD